MQIEYYAANVVKALRDKHINARFYTNRYKFDDFKDFYSKYFSVIETDTDVICSVKKEISIEELKEKFRGYLSVDALLAFIDDDVVFKSLLMQNTQNDTLVINKQLKKKKVSVSDLS